MKYIGYIRKSTDTEDRQVLSLESQENELRRLAQSSGIELVDILKESRSAKKLGRPVFAQMIKMINSGKAEGILCWKLDRLARNFIDGGLIIDSLQKSIIKEIKTSEGSHFPNDNVLMIAMQFGTANQYSRDISTNVKRGNRTKLEKGEWPNCAPFGYVNDKINKTIKVDKKKSKYVLRAVELYATGGYTLEQITKILFDEGLKSNKGTKISKNQIYRFITSKFYCGFMERDGKLYQGNHQPIISSSLYEKAQDVLNGKLHPHPKKNFYSAQGFLKCDSCGCALTCDTQKGYIYYYCTNGKGNCEEHKKYMRSEYLDNLISKMFLDLKFDEEYIEVCAEAYKAKNKDRIDYHESTLESLSNELKMLLDKELALTDGYSAKLVRDEVYKLKIQEIENRRVELNQQIKKFKLKSGVSEVTLERIKNVFIDGNKASNQYLEVNDPKKRHMLEKLLSNATVKNKNIVSYQFKSMYQILANAPKNGDVPKMLGD